MGFYRLYSAILLIFCYSSSEYKSAGEARRSRKSIPSR
ncbi:hypothetical protein C789_1232 [Microcystis aeruginosa FACHB-905 = DIANCHI905]|nr:hypothetical protein C789_1232 [Microcystis aeruginosa FACHB-905 = DIANCHI905]